MFLQWENNSGKKNAIKDVQQISLSHMINWNKLGKCEMGALLLEF